MRSFEPRLKRLEVLERAEIEKEKQAYRLFLATLTPQEAKRFWELFRKPPSEYSPADWAEATCDWSTEIRFHDALVKVLGFYPKVALACIEQKEQELGLVVATAATIPDRINQIISCLKGLAQAEQAEEEGEESDIETVN